MNHFVCFLQTCAATLCNVAHVNHSVDASSPRSPSFGATAHLHSTFGAPADVPHFAPLQVEVNTPEEHMGDVIGDLNSRRGLIGEFIDKPANMKLVKASVPLSEMFQYVSTLRGMSKGALCCDITPLFCLEA